MTKTRLSSVMTIISIDIQTASLKHQPVIISTCHPSAKRGSAVGYPDIEFFANEALCLTIEKDHLTITD